MPSILLVAISVLGFALLSSDLEAQQGERRKISPEIFSNRDKKQTPPPGVPMPEHRRRVQEKGLNSENLGAEECAVYSQAPLTPAQVAELAAQGIEIYPDLWIPPVPGKHPNGFHLATVPYASLDAVAANASILALESVENRLEPNNDLGLEMVNAIQVQNGQGVIARNGAGVKIAIADSGFDLTHADLPVPIEKYDVTTGNGVANWSTNVANTVTAHGTHVAGTAVGSGLLSSGKYKGGGPGASVYLYKIGNNITGSASGADIIEAINRSVSQGVKIFSMSYGGWSTFMDGSQPMQQAIDSATASGMTCFISAGNEGNDNAHDSLLVAPGVTTSTFSFSLTNPSGSSAYTSIVDVLVAWRDGVAGDENMILSCTNLGSGEALVEDFSDSSTRGTEAKWYELTPNLAASASKTYTFTLRNAASTGITPLVHVYRGSDRGTFTSPDAGYTVGSPADADTAIAVGAWTQRRTWTNYLGSTFSTGTVGTLASFSSRGPRIDGVVKPDIVAPGAQTISARDSVPGLADTDSLIIDNDGLNLNGSGPANYYALQGTSMACPLAAGTAALVLEASPTLTPAQLRSALITTSSLAGNPSASAGYGLIDILAAVQSVAKIPQAITFNAIPDKIATDTVVLSATGGGSGNPVTFAVTAGPGTITGGNVLSFTGAGTVTVTASQAGNASYSAAPNVSRSVFVTKANAGLTLTSLSQTYNGSARVATASTSPGGLSVSFTYDGLSTPPVNAGSYAVVGTINDNIYQGTASGTLVVGKATSGISLSNLSQVYTGTAKSVTVATTPPGLANSVTYNGISFAPTNVGTYSVVATVNDPNYQGSTSGTFNITKATATITLTNLSQTYSGGPRPVTVTTNPGGLSYTLTYNGIASAPFDAGTYNVAAAINHANYQGSNTAVLEIAQATQVIDFPLPPASTLATATVALTASGGGSGNPIVYAIVSGPGELQGNQLTFTGPGTVRVSANQAGGTNHLPAAPVERDFNVVRDTASVTLSSMSHVYDGGQKQPVATTTPEGLPVSFTFDGNSTAPSSVGTYALVATVSDARYSGSATGTFEIEKAPASVTLSSLSQVYNGTPRSVSVTTNPPGLAVSLSYAGSPTPPTGAGSYPVTATIVENNYAGSGGETLVVAKAAQSINFPPIAEQEATTTLPLTATGGGSGNPIVFSVTEGPANLNGNSLTFFGTGDVSIRADQAGDSNHEAAPAVFRTFPVTRERVEISITGLSQPYDGTPRPVSVTTNPAGLPVRVTYAGSLDPPTVPGSYFVLALVDEEFYEGDAGGTLVVSKGIQTIDFPQPGPALANAMVTLSASGGDSGNAVVFEVTDGPGEVSGNQLSFTGDGFVTVRATQPGNALYDDATPVDRIIGVTKAPATVILTDLAQTFDGSSKVPTATTSPPGLSVSYQFDGSPDPAVHAGSYAVVATVSDPRYSGSASDSFVIARASQVIDFTQPAPALATDIVVLQATGGGSGNGVEFSIQSGPGSIAGNLLTFSAAGTVVILADQDGDLDHDPAANVSRTLVVSKAPPSSLSLTRMRQVFDGTARVVVPVTIPPGLNVELEYDGSSDPPIGTGSYEVVATINDPVYEGTITGNLIVDDPYRLELVPGGGLPAISTLGAPTVRSFAVAPYEVTWSVWLTVRDWANAHGYDLGSVGEGCAPDHPVRGVSWFDAVKWCNARTEWENETLSRQIEPAYRFEGNVFRSGTPAGADEVVCNPETSGYRLPSGIEREFAARGGELGGGALYPGSNDPLAVGWHASNAAGAPCDLSGGLGTHPAGDLLPNELGLYDLAGNVAEWTGDAAPGNAASRMANGGDWDDPASGLLHSTLGEALPSTRDSHIGFRVARSLSEAIAAAVDRTDLTWETGGDQTWFASAGAPGTMSITAASPPPVESEEHWVEVEATGPGNLSFLWALATPAGAADLTVEIDGLAVASAADNGGLVEESLYLTTGTHRVRWRNRGLSSAATQPGVHGAWLDQVVLTPAVIPDLNTMDVTGLGEEGALMNAELMDDGGSPVSAIGFTIVLPGGGEIDLVGDPGGLPDFAEPADSLTPGTTYRVRAYATNEVGTGYGEWVRFTTVEQVSVEENAAVRDREIESGDGHVFDFTLSSPRHLVVTSSGGAPIIAQLLDADGNIVAESTATGDFEINELLLAGDYRLRIQRGSEPGTTAAYQVSLDGTLLAESLPDVAVGPSSGLQTGRGLRSGRTGQNVILFSPKARPVQAFATVANMGTLPDEMRIFGSRGTADFVLSYFGTGGNITGGMLTGRAASSELVAGGDIEVIRVAVTPNKRRIVKKVKRRTVTLKKTLLVSVRATSTFDLPNPDMGYIEVKTK